MADVRSLLRKERAQRRIDHPQARYSATGTLECTVCHIPLKSDTEVWNKHLRSPQHIMRAERLRIGTFKASGQPSPQETSSGSKKRKASDGEDDSRKRTRPVVDLPSASLDATDGASNDSSREELRVMSSAHTTLPSHPLPTPTVTAQIDEEEWAAFERDIATPPPDPALPLALMAEATITAAPLTAAELAAQSRRAATFQSKERRDAEVEGEKEDAARALEEEFDEMEDLEERVRRLREMREELRDEQARRSEGQKSLKGMDEGDFSGTSAADEERYDEEDEDDDWGVWGQ